MPQSLGQVYVHVIYSTKNRVPFIDFEIEDALFKVLHRSITKAGNYPIIVGGYLDHVHLCFNLHRTKTLSKSVEIIKNISSKWMKKQGEQYLNFYWQNGYGAFSVGKQGLENVKAYIKNQKTHHQNQGYKSEVRELMMKHALEFDERYFWD